MSLVQFLFLFSSPVPCKIKKHNGCYCYHSDLPHVSVPPHRLLSLSVFSLTQQQLQRFYQQQQLHDVYKFLIIIFFVFGILAII